jgi:hypothetical protein
MQFLPLDDSRTHRRREHFGSRGFVNESNSADLRLNLYRFSMSRIGGELVRGMNLHDAILFAQLAV